MKDDHDTATAELPIGMPIDARFRDFVNTLRPPFAFNPGRFDGPNDLFVSNGKEWRYVGTPGDTWQACALMADEISGDFAQRALARWEAEQLVDCGECPRDGCIRRCMKAPPR